MMCVLSWIVTTLVSLAASLTLFAQAPAADPAAAISRADEQFAAAVADRNVERFLSFIAENATFSGGIAQEEHGRAAVQKAWAIYFVAGGPTITWHPDKAEVLPGGQVGYTVGRWERRDKGSAGQPIVLRGSYLTVWRKHPDGAWRVVYDTGGN